MPNSDTRRAGWLLRCRLSVYYIGTTSTTSIALIYMNRAFGRYLFIFYSLRMHVDREVNAEIGAPLRALSIGDILLCHVENKTNRASGATRTRHAALQAFYHCTGEKARGMKQQQEKNRSWKRVKPFLLECMYRSRVGRSQVNR